MIPAQFYKKVEYDNRDCRNALSGKDISGGRELY